MSARGAPPRSSRVGRLADYLQQMYPPAVLVPGGLASFCSIYFSLQALGGAAKLTFTWRAAIAATTTILFTLLLRVYDELKDVDTDLRLGRAGDPRYVGRPIVTGHVRKDDLVALRWTLSAALVALNVAAGFPLPGIAFVLAFALTWLSYHWFFWPKMKDYLLVAFITHNPLALALSLYVVAVYVRDFAPERLRTWLVVAVMVGHWALVAAWEVARKIRAPEDETDYVTYSKVLGWRVATIGALAFVALSAVALLVVARAIGLSATYSAVVAGGALLVAAACARFLRRPDARTANLRPAAELYAGIVAVATAVVLVVQFGLRFSP